MKYRTALVIAALLLCMGTMLAGNPKKNIDHRADASKALQLVEAGTSTIGNSILGAAVMFQMADTLNGDDKTIQMASNNFKLLLMPKGNPIYDSQLEMLESSPIPDKGYYYTITNAMPLNEGGIDSLKYFDTALKAHKRFPDEYAFIDDVLGRGISYLYDKRFVDSADGETLDTLDLTPQHVAFAESLLVLGDSIEKQNGYYLPVDRSRAAILTILDRKDDLKKLAQNLAERDSTDVDLLDLRTSLAYAIGDSVGVYELGIKRFEIDPAGEHVYSLYNAMPNDTLRVKLADAVIAKALDSDIDTNVRMNILRALAEAYYDNVDSPDGTVELLDRISETIAEICAEDPLDASGYTAGTLLVKGTHWVENYGYKHWMNSVGKIDDNVVSLPIAQILVSVVNNKPEFEKSLKVLIDEYSENRPELVMDTKLALAQYYFNSELYQQALDIVKPITLVDLQENARLVSETYKDDDEIDGELSTDTDNQMERFVALQTLVAECQIKLDKVDDALSTLNHVIAIDPENAGALNNLAYYMCEHGRDLTIALSLVERSLALEPDNLNSIDTRAWILFKKGDTEGAYNDMVNLFDKLKVDIIQAIEPENEKTVKEILDENSVNSAIMGPIMGHLLIILDAKGESDEKALDRLVEFIKDVEPDNDDLKKFVEKNASR